MPKPTLDEKPPPEQQKTDRKSALSFGHAFMLVLLILLLAIFLYTVRMFVIPVIIAAVFAGLFHPFYRWFAKILRGKTGLASLITCILLLACLMLPVYFIANTVAREAFDLYSYAEDKVSDIIEEGEEGLIGKVKRMMPERLVSSMERIDWQKSLAEIAKTSGSLIASIINKTTKSTFNLVMNLFIVLFTMFYFFQDGENIIRRLKYLSPLGDKYEDQLLERFASVTRATVKGALLLGLIQGSLGALVLWIFGVPTVVLWGVIMVIMSVIPLVGSWVVMYPAGIYKIIIGDIWQGIFIILFTAVVIGNLDNLLRPRLVGRDAKMHDLLIFFSTLGGISVFGVMGFILGPVITALLLTLLDIYSTEFQAELEFAETRDVSSVVIGVNDAGDLKPGESHDDKSDNKK